MGLGLFYKKTLKKIYSSSYLSMVKIMVVNIFNFIRRPKSLMVLVFVTSIMTIVVSTFMFYVDSKKNELDFSAIYKSDLTNRFVEKHDLFRLNEVISRLHFLVGKDDSGQDLFASIPLEPSFVQQAYIAYLGMNTTRREDLVCLPTNITPEQYMKTVDVKSIDNANSYIDNSVAESERLERMQSRLFYLLILIQTLNVLFATGTIFCKKEVIK